MKSSVMLSERTAVYDKVRRGLWKQASSALPLYNHIGMVSSFVSRGMSYGNEHSPSAMT